VRYAKWQIGKYVHNYHNLMVYIDMVDRIVRTQSSGLVQHKICIRCLSTQVLRQE